MLPDFYKHGDSLKQVFDQLPYDYTKVDRSVPLENSQQNGYSPIYRNELSISTGLVSSLTPSTTTLVELFEQNVHDHQDLKYLGECSSTDNYIHLTYKETLQTRNKLGSGLLQLSKTHLNKHNDFIVSVYSPNRYEWHLTDLAAQAYSITLTALYDTLGPDSIKYIINHTKSPILFTIGSKIDSILQLTPQLSTLKIIISFDESIPQQLHDKAHSRRIHLYTFQQVLQLGSSNPFDPIPPSPSTIASICYTSGTSGSPKGVLISQQNLITAIFTLYAKINVERTNAKHYAFLPLAHILQRVNTYMVSPRGGHLDFPRDGSDPKTFFTDFHKCKPSHLALVPRVYNKLESLFKNKIYGSDTLANRMTRRAVEYKIQKHKRGQDASHWFYDRFIHRKLRSLVGFDDVNYFVSGAAPIHPDTLAFLKALFNLNEFYEGYGSTETCAGIFLNSGHELNPGCVGSITPTTEFRLKDVPEMNYTYESNRTGEILVRGPQIFQGYYKAPDMTKEAFEDGWYMTGDIARVDDQGKIYIIDRRKNFFKLAQGEFIAPEKIENKYISGNSDLVAQIWCYGTPSESYLVGIVGLDIENINAFLSQSSMSVININDPKEVRSLLNDTRFRKLILQRLNERVQGLQGFEKIKNVHLAIEPLTVQNDTLTPTLKVKRFRARKLFENVLAALYVEGPLLQKSKL